MNATMDEDQIEERLVAYINETEKDLDWAWETYDAKLEESKENANEDVAEETLASSAVEMVRAELVQGTRTGTVEEVSILSIGHGGVEQWSDGDGGKKDVLKAYGVVQPEDGPAGIGAFLCDSSDGLDPYNLKDTFGTLDNLTGYFKVSESDELTGVYVCNTTDESRVSEDTSDMSAADKRDFLHNFVDEEADIANISQHLSATNADGYAAEWGTDMKRMTVTVVDWYAGDGFNTYTVLDSSVVDSSELTDEVVSDRGRTPGLTVWCPDEFFNYGNDSQLEIYGTLTRGDDGQISMNACGIYPLIPFDQDQQSGGDQTNESNVSETSI